MLVHTIYIHTDAHILPSHSSHILQSPSLSTYPEMKITTCFHALCLLRLIFLPSLISSQACQTTCGNLPIKYPFGTGSGCGDPRFQKYINCDQQKLTLTTHTGCYPVTNIDYDNQVIYISDPSMSTCSCTQPSKGFGLDWDAPFSFHDDTVFTLLDCSVTSSPIYQSNGINTGDNSSVIPMCDKEGTPICSFLYSCKAISMLSLPISTCCVYTPVDLGPAFEMDLQKLQCSSYSGFYSFSGQESNPDNWKYGIALKYKFNVYNDYPGTCADCERSGGACSYGGNYNLFVCNCPNGINTTSDCIFPSYNDALRFLPWQRGIWVTYFLAWLML